MTEQLYQVPILHRICMYLGSAGARIRLLSINKKCRENIDNCLFWQDCPPGKNGRLLRFFIVRGNLAYVKMSIKCGIKLHYWGGPYWYYPMYIAAEQGRLEIVKCLVENDTEILMDAIYAAQERGNQTIVEYLVKQALVHSERILTRLTSEFRAENTAFADSILPHTPESFFRDILAETTVQYVIFDTHDDVYSRKMCFVDSKLRVGKAYACWAFPPFDNIFYCLREFGAKCSREFYDKYANIDRDPPTSDWRVLICHACSENAYF